VSFLLYFLAFYTVCKSLFLFSLQYISQFPQSILVNIVAMYYDVLVFGILYLTNIIYLVDSIIFGPRV
jgi:hypothetical protein